MITSGVKNWSMKGRSSKSPLLYRFPESASSAFFIFSSLLRAAACQRPIFLLPKLNGYCMIDTETTERRIAMIYTVTLNTAIDKTADKAVFFMAVGGKSVAFFL